MKKIERDGRTDSGITDVADRRRMRSICVEMEKEEEERGNFIAPPPPPSSGPMGRPRAVSYLPQPERRLRLSAKHEGIHLFGDP